MLVGAHISVSGGYDKAVEYALEVGCECLQIFAKSPRQWRGKALDREAASHFAQLRAQYDLDPLVTHTAYLINLATEDEELWSKSVAALADEIDRGRILQALGVVTHLGSNPDAGRGSARIAKGIAAAYKACSEPDSGTRLLLENTAGAGNTFGGPIEELGTVIDHAEVPDGFLGMCLDTCHAHAYGIDLSTPEAWEDVLQTIRESCGQDALAAIHANDCLFELGSKRDRHAWIGDGFMGEGAFAAMMCTESLRDLPALLEMPGEVPQKDAENIERLKELRRRCHE